MDIIIKTPRVSQLRFEQLQLGDVFTWGAGCDWYVKSVGNNAILLGGNTATNRIYAGDFFRGRDLTRAKTVEITPEA